MSYMNRNLPLASEVPYEPRQAVYADGEPACTECRLLAQNDSLTVVECILHTGRTHQRRACFSAVGHPLAGDIFYGGATTCIKRQAPHCRNVQFPHPVTGEWMHIKTPVPTDILEMFYKKGLYL